MKTATVRAYYSLSEAGKKSGALRVSKVGWLELAEYNFFVPSKLKELKE